MNFLNPLKTGLALAATMGVSYSVCAFLYSLWPEQGINFLNALFHGLDFHKLLSAEPVRFSMFVYPLLVLMVWGGLVGTVFAWLYKLLSGSRG